ncbi:MAG: MerR family transcriptional regulator [Verrucomicrobia bacterium]|nr:MAG: MerR family transcriptional regulator [Verrucomicrobiota bacterium]
MTFVDPDRGMSLAELAEITGCPPRTIRYYIARGLLPPPLKAGPGACYGEEHLRRLKQIRAWQAEGLTLAEIGHRLTGAETAATPRLERTSWWSWQPADDVVVYVRADVPPWRARRIQRALQELAGRLASTTEPEENTDENES